MIIITYFKRLFGLWIMWVFTGLDLIAFFVGVTNPTFYIPSWVYWTIGGLGFVMSNIILFKQLQERMEKYESEEANLQIHVNRIQTSSSNEIMVSTKRYEAGLGEEGIPFENMITAYVEIENLGKEAGVLEWEVDVYRSVIPDIFGLYIGKTNGHFFGQKTLEIPGRTRIKFVWVLGLASLEKDPAEFAKKLVEKPTFTIYLNYKTKRIGSVSEPKLLVISGDFSDYCRQLKNKWKKRGGLDDLVKILQTVSEEKQ